MTCNYLGSTDKKNSSHNHSPQTKMSKFAKTKFLLCRVVGVFSSRGSTFFLARQCFGAFTDAPIGGGVCKNFYTFFAGFWPVLLPNHLHLFCILPCIKVVGKMRKMRSWSIKRGGFRGKNDRKVGKTIFRMSAENGQKGVRNGCFGRRKGQNRRNLRDRKRRSSGAHRSEAMSFIHTRWSRTSVPVTRHLIPRECLTETLMTS